MAARGANKAAGVGKQPELALGKRGGASASVRGRVASAGSAATLSLSGHGDGERNGPSHVGGAPPRMPSSVKSSQLLEGPVGLAGLH